MRASRGRAQAVTNLPAGIRVEGDLKVAGGCYELGMAARLLLVHSPLVGCAAWDLVAAELVRGGHEVSVPDLTGTVTAGPPYCLRQAEVVARSASIMVVQAVRHGRNGGPGTGQRLTRDRSGNHDPFGSK
jgi:hypothetical protein